MQGLGETQVRWLQIMRRGLYGYIETITVNAKHEYVRLLLIWKNTHMGIGFTEPVFSGRSCLFYFANGIQSVLM